MDLVLKRLMAYVIDILIVSICMTPILNWSVINPYIDEYTENYTEYTELLEQANAGDIDPEDAEYEEKIIDLNYQINKYKVVSSSISAGSLLLYFALLQWALKGQTIGKKIMKIKVVANREDKKLNIGNYILRSLILNNIIFTIVLIVGVYLFKEDGYYNLSMIVSYLQLLVMSIIMLMIVLRKDFRGLHDIVAGTKVIDVSPNALVDKKEDDEEKVTIEAKENTKEKETKKVKIIRKRKTLNLRKRNKSFSFFD